MDMDIWFVTSEAVKQINSLTNTLSLSQSHSHFTFTYRTMPLG